MGKTSIFSKDYEKVMRKRRKRLRIIYFLTFLVVVLLSVKIMNYDFSHIYKRLQNLVSRQGDNAEGIKDTKVENLIDVMEEKKEKLDDKNIEDKNAEENTEEKVNVVVDGININLVLESKKGVKSIVNIENIPENYYYDISINGENALIIDNLQNIYLTNVSGDIIDLTLKQYIAPDGEIFEKNNIITTYSGYLWHSSAKFLGDNKIVYITNIPYFGYNLNKYVSIIDIQSKSHETLWSMKGKNINFGNFDNKGLEVTIDGNIRYIDKNGEETS
jgi:hypothetical protein